MADALPAALVPAAAPPAAPSPGTPAAVPGPVPWRGAWRELIAYLLGGFGLFLLFSFGLSYIFRQANILTSFVLYATNFLVFAGSAYFLGVRWRRQTWAQFGLRGFDPRWLLAALLLAAAVLPLRAVAALAAEALAGNGGALADMQPRLDIIAPSGPLALNFIITLFGAGILAPIAEELYFRGLLFSWFRSRFSFWPAVLDHFRRRPPGQRGRRRLQLLPGPGPGHRLRPRPLPLALHCHPHHQQQPGRGAAVRGDAGVSEAGGSMTKRVHERRPACLIDPQLLALQNGVQGDEGLFAGFADRASVSSQMIMSPGAVRSLK